MQEAVEIFDAFMAKTTRLEELQKLGNQLLAGYQQELEYFRRPLIHETSTLVAAILENNHNARLSKYREAGCRHSYAEQRVAVKLDSYLRGLQNHIQQAHEIIAELWHLVDNATCIMHEELSAMLEKANLSTSMLHQQDSDSTLDLSNEGISIISRHASDYVTMMICIFNMLEQDYQMQEKIVTALGLDTPSEPLQNYCLMWTLRPFIDERVIEEGLSLAGK